MPEITITLGITEQQVAFFQGRDFLVVPMAEPETIELAKALQSIHETLRINRKVLATLNELLESKDATPKQIADTLNQLGEQNRIALTLIDTVRAYLGRAHGVGQKKDSGQMQ